MTDMPSLGEPEPSSASLPPRTLDGADVSAVAYVIFILIAMCCGGIVRFSAVLTNSFPLGDGGLFYDMVNDLLAHRFSLPSSVSYNGSLLPFTYPPAGFYVVAALHSTTGASVVQILRFFPAAVSVLTIGAFAYLAIAVLSRVAAVASVFVFALLPADSVQQIKGGGMTRSPGMLFALLTLAVVIPLFRRKAWKRLPGATVLAALTVLTHPEWTLFAAVGTVVLLAACEPDRRSLLLSACLCLGTAVLTAPWWILCVLRHGVASFLAPIIGSASALPWYAGPLNLFLLNLTVNRDLLFSLGTALALAGLLVCLVNRQWLLPLWLLAIVVLSERGPLDKGAAILALLAGVGVQEVLLPLLLAKRTSQRRMGGDTLRPGSIFVASVLVFAVLQGTLNSIVTETSAATSLSSSDRSAMRWVSLHTGPSSTFLVITGAPWATDNISEWFPTLTRRTSVATVQGSEWLPGQFAAQYRRDVSAQSCASQSAGCVDAWQTGAPMRISYVYVTSDQPGDPSKDCCWHLRAALGGSTEFRLVYNGPGAAIYERT
jgi:hypothetical protein